MSGVQWGLSIMAGVIVALCAFVLVLAAQLDGLRDQVNRVDNQLETLGWELAADEIERETAEIIERWGNRDDN